MLESDLTTKHLYYCVKTQQKDQQNHLSSVNSLASINLLLKKRLMATLTSAMAVDKSITSPSDGRLVRASLNYKQK